MSTPLEEIAPVPKAPRPPDVEDVLGPPPHAPHIGSHGKGLRLAGRFRSPAPPPRLARPRPQQPAPPAPPAARPQKIVIEPKAPPAEAKPEPKPKTPQEEYAPVEPEINKHAGKPVQRAVRNAAKVRDQINASGLRPPRENADEGEPDAGQGFTPEQREKRRQQYEAMRATLDAPPRAPETQS